MKITHGRTMALALACAGFSPVGAASPTYFKACDGYGSPSADGDGMTKPATALFGLIATLGSAGNTRRATPVLGAQGIAACDQALGDPRLLDRFWLRKASLLRARAIHDLAAGQTAAALADLDKAEAAALDPADPYYRRSLALGNQLVRAYALQRNGEADKAREIVAAVLRDRPFDRHIGLAAVAITGDEEAVLNGSPLLWHIARLAPKFIDRIFLNAFNHGDFPQAIALYPHLVPPLAVVDIGMRSNETRFQESRNDALTLVYRAERRARLAYALAATGRKDAARHEIEAAASALAAGTPAAIPPPEADARESRKDREACARNALLVLASARARQAVEAWRGLVEARITLGEGRPLDADRASLALLRNGAALDFYQAVKRVSPNRPDVDAAIAQAGSKPVHEPMDEKVAIKLLFASLPHTEIQKRVASYKKANSELMGYLWGGVSGFKIIPDPDGASTKIQFVGEESSASVVEEMALLRAADLAREAGKEGIVVKGRSDYERTNNTLYYGSIVRSDPNGYSTVLEVEYVDSIASSAKYKAVPWRVLNAQDIIDRLGPVYFAPAAPESKPGG